MFGEVINIQTYYFCYLYWCFVDSKSDLLGLVLTNNNYISEFIESYVDLFWNRYWLKFFFRVICFKIAFPFGRLMDLYQLYDS